MAGSSPAMTVEGVRPRNVDRTYKSRARGAQPGSMTRAGQQGRPSLAMTAATSSSAEPPASTVTTPGSSGVGSSSVSNWLRSSEAGIYS